MSSLVREVEGEQTPLEDQCEVGPVLGSAPEPTGEAEFMRQELSKLYVSFVDELVPEQQTYFRAAFRREAHPGRGRQARRAEPHAGADAGDEAAQELPQVHAVAPATLKGIGLRRRWRLMMLLFGGVQ